MLAVRFNVAPSQSGPLLPAVGASGIGFTVTDVVPAAPVHPFTVIVTEYVPEAPIVAFDMLGFCTDDVKLPGPVQLYVAPATVLAERFNVDPAQIGELLDAVGAAGVGLTVTLTVPAGPVHPLTVAVTEYVPDAASVTLAMVGFCNEDVKPFGPLHE